MRITIGARFRTLATSHFEWGSRGHSIWLSSPTSQFELSCQRGPAWNNAKVTGAHCVRQSCC